MESFRLIRFLEAIPFVQPQHKRSEARINLTGCAEQNQNSYTTNMEEGGACGCTSALYHAVLQYLLHPDGHVGHILGNSLDSLHQAGRLKPVHTTAEKHVTKANARAGALTHC